MGKNYQALKQYENAEKAFRQAHFMIPHRFYPLYLLAKMYFESGQTEKGKAIALQLLHKKTKIHSTAIDEMKNEIQFLLQDSLKYLPVYAHPEKGRCHGDCIGASK